MRSISARLTLRFALSSSILLVVIAASLYVWTERELATRFALFQERITAESGGTPKEIESDRTDKARSREMAGAGLGLAIAKSFTEAHGGRIQVKSAPDVGTTFTLLFPAVGE